MHGSFEVDIILDGTAKCIRGTKSKTVKPGDIILFNPHELHSFVSLEDAPLTILSLQIHQLFARRYIEIIPKLRFRCSDVDDLSSGEYAYLKNNLFQVALAYFSNNASTKFDVSGYSILLLGRLVAMLSWELAEQPDSSEKELEKNRMQRLIDYIDENYRQRITLSMLAEMEGITTTHLSHFFRKAFGVSFQTYISSQRLEKALVLMHDKTVSIVDICMDCGFSDRRYLEAACQKAFGCSVTQYRERIDAQGEVEPLHDSAALYKRCYRKESINIIESYLGKETMEALCKESFIQINPK
jgi:AraC-like DNA-binding protein